MVGVLYDHGTQQHFARAEREVILSGGSINSPRLLLLSGVGPAQHLRQHDIDVVVDLPGVGANLHDHPTLPIVWKTQHATDVLKLAQNPLAVRQFNAGEPGPLNSVLCDVGGFFSIGADPKVPDIEFHTAPTAFADGLDQPSTPSSLKPCRCSTQLAGVLCASQRKLGRHPPSISLAFLSERTDFVVLLVGVQAFIEMSTAGPLGPYLETMFFPTPARFETAEFKAAARAHTQTMYHPVGSCAMGRSLDAVRGPPTSPTRPPSGIRLRRAGDRLLLAGDRGLAGIYNQGHRDGDPRR